MPKPRYAPLTCWPMPGTRGSSRSRMPGGRDRVAVALEHPVVLAQRDDRRGEDDEPDDEPLRLLAREVLVEPVEHHEPEAREHRDEREEVRVGVRQRHAQHEVRGEAQAEEERAVGQRRVRSRTVVALHEDRGEARGDEQGGGDQREELAVALGHRGGQAARARARARGRPRRRASAAGGRAASRGAPRAPASTRDAGDVVGAVEVDAGGQVVGQPAVHGDEPVRRRCRRSRRPARRGTRRSRPGRARSGDDREPRRAPRRPRRGASAARRPRARRGRRLRRGAAAAAGDRRAAPRPRSARPGRPARAASCTSVGWSWSLAAGPRPTSSRRNRTTVMLSRPPARWRRR